LKQPLPLVYIGYPLGGDTIADLLEERDWTQAQLAERLGYTTMHISQIINGKAFINQETALKLERVLGRLAEHWGEFAVVFEQSRDTCALTRALLNARANWRLESRE
jgi:plasmid maintenance system antidote protein VapI